MTKRKPKRSDLSTKGTEAMLKLKAVENREPIANGTTPPTSAKVSNETDSVAQACRDLEGAVCDIANMAALAEDAINDAIGGDHSHITGNEDAYYIPQADSLAFAILHLKELIDKFKERYYNAIKRGEAGPHQVSSRHSLRRAR